jgi:hypothetical protein
VKIECDECSEDCLEKSYFIDDMDLCPSCFEKNAVKFAGAEDQKHGVAAKKEKKANRDEPTEETSPRDENTRSPKKSARS